MEDNTLRDGWSWMDEDVRLDGQFPLDMSHGVWEDMVDNDTVVRSLFQTNPKEMDPPALSFLEQDSEDCNPAPLKRRRILEFDDENVDISSYLPEPKEISANTSDNFLVEVCENLQIVDPASSSPVWYLANEGSLSSVDDVVEQSSGSWRAGCVSDSDTSDVQELAHHANNPPASIYDAGSVLKSANKWKLLNRQCENEEGWAGSNRAISTFTRVREASIVAAAVERMPKYAGAERVLKSSLGLPICIGETHRNPRRHHITGH